MLGIGCCVLLASATFYSFAKALKNLCATNFPLFSVHIFFGCVSRPRYAFLWSVCVCLCVSPHPTEVLTYKLQCCCGNSQNRIVLPLFFWQPVRTVSIYVMRTIHYGIAAIAHHLVFTQHSNDRLSRIVARIAPPK